MKMTLRDIEAEVNDTMNKFLNSTIEVSASDLNLDYRAGYRLYIDADYAAQLSLKNHERPPSNITVVSNISIGI
jgi:hypothetical protein